MVAPGTQSPTYPECVLMRVPQGSSRRCGFAEFFQARDDTKKRSISAPLVCNEVCVGYFFVLRAFTRSSTFVFSSGGTTARPSLFLAALSTASSAAVNMFFAFFSPLLTL